VPDPSAERDDCPQCLLGNLNWLLSQAHYALATQLAAAFEPLGLTPRGHSVLAAAMTGSFTQKQLADLVGLDKTTMVATLDELERAGLARRGPSDSDRRAHVIEVTPRGRKTVTAANKVARRVESDALHCLGRETSGEFVDALARLVRERLGEPAACKGIRRREPR
jgi:DNA-binding MarR family transcriptional regulator